MTKKGRSKRDRGRGRGNVPAPALPTVPQAEPTCDVNLSSDIDDKAPDSDISDKDSEKGG